MRTRRSKKPKPSPGERASRIHVKNTIRLAVLAVLCAAPTLDAAEPAARRGHVFVYDQAREELLLFGGASVRGS
jgi:hypothetical protein